MKNSNTAKRIFSVVMCLYPYLLFVYAGILSKIEDLLPKASQIPDIISAVVFVIDLVLLIIFSVLLGKGEKPMEPKERSLWAMVMKFCHIPFYIFVFLCAVFAQLLDFIPVPFMIFLGLSAIILAIMVDTWVLFHSAIVGVGAIVAARKANLISKAESIIYSIMQFIFCLDVISSVILFCRIWIRKKK